MRKMMCGTRLETSRAGHDTPLVQTGFLMSRPTCRTLSTTVQISHTGLSPAMVPVSKGFCYLIDYHVQALPISLFPSHDTVSYFLQVYLGHTPAREVVVGEARHALPCTFSQKFNRRVVGVHIFDLILLLFQERNDCSEWELWQPFCRTNAIFFPWSHLWRKEERAFKKVNFLWMISIISDRCQTPFQSRKNKICYDNILPNNNMR